MVDGKDILNILNDRFTSVFTVEDITNPLPQGLTLLVI